MNNETDTNYFFGAVNDDGSYTKICKISDSISIIDNYRIPNKKNAKRKYKIFYSVLKQKEKHMLLRMFENNVTIEMQVKLSKNNL